MIKITIRDLTMKKSKKAPLLRMPKRRGMPVFAVESCILIVRHRRVILDVDLAELYGVTVMIAPCPGNAYCGYRRSPQAFV